MCFRITASGRTGRIKTKSTSSPSFLPPLLARQFPALLISSLLQATNFTQFLQGQYPKSHSYLEILPKTPRAQPTLDGDFFCLYVFVSHFRPRDALKKIFLFVYTQWQLKYTCFWVGRHLEILFSWVTWPQMRKQKLQAKKVFSSRFLVVFSSLSRRRKQNFEMQQKWLSG